MGIRFYPTKGSCSAAKPTSSEQPTTTTGASTSTAVGASASPATSIGGGAAGGSSLGMRGGYNADETFIMAKRAKDAASQPPDMRVPIYRQTGYIAEQRRPEGNVQDTTYMMRVGGVLSHQILDDPTTKINADAVKVWDEQLKSSRTFSMDREMEWTGRPQVSI